MRTVRQGEQAALMRWGRFVDVYGPGTYTVNPSCEKLQRISVKVQNIALPKQVVMTQDGIQVKIDAVTFFRVVDIEKALFDVADVTSSMHELAQGVLKSIVGQYELRALLRSRGEVAIKTQELITAGCREWGIHPERTEIKDIDVPKDVENALSADAQAQSKSKAKVTLAKAEKEAAGHNAEAARLLNETPGGMQLRYLQTLREMSSNGQGSTIILPENVSGLSGVAAAKLLSN